MHMRSISIKLCHFYAGVNSIMNNLKCAHPEKGFQMKICKGSIRNCNINESMHS